MSVITQSILMLRRECVAFVNAGFGGLLVYLLLVPAWGWLMHVNGSAGWLWLVFFSVIVCGSVSAGVFAQERLSGALEILLTSGIERRAILIGKLLFVVGLGLLLGGAASLIPLFIDGCESYRLFAEGLLVYGAACCMNTAFDAWLSFRVGNPRLVSVLNLGALFLFVLAGEALRQIMPWSALHAAGVMIVLSGIFLWMAEQELRHERVLRPPV